MLFFHRNVYIGEGVQSINDPEALKIKKALFFVIYSHVYMLHVPREYYNLLISPNFPMFLLHSLFW